LAAATSWLATLSVLGSRRNVPAEGALAALGEAGAGALELGLTEARARDGVAWAVQFYGGRGRRTVFQINVCPGYHASCRIQYTRKMSSLARNITWYLVCVRSVEPRTSGGYHEGEGQAQEQNVASLHIVPSLLVRSRFPVLVLNC
jgi:hypothetical protein